jgi:DNA-binding NarL/FixJ family response regulator
MAGRLTKRELQVAALVAEGCDNQTVADRLGIAVGTVKNRLTMIFLKVSVWNRTQLANWYRERKK